MAIAFQLDSFQTEPVFPAGTLEAFQSDIGFPTPSKLIYLTGRNDALQRLTGRNDALVHLTGRYDGTTH